MRYVDIEFDYGEDGERYAYSVALPLWRLLGGDDTYYDGFLYSQIKEEGGVWELEEASIPERVDDREY